MKRMPICSLPEKVDTNTQTMLILTDSSFFYTKINNVFAAAGYQHNVHSKILYLLNKRLYLL